MNPKLSIEKIKEQSKTISMIVSDPNREINYEILRKYLRLYCYYLDLLKLKCKVSLQLGFLKCLGCNLLFKPESQQYIALDCQKHAFDSLECAKNFINLYLSNILD